MFLSMIPYRNESTKQPHPISLQIPDIISYTVHDKGDLSMETTIDETDNKLHPVSCRPQPDL